MATGKQETPESLDRLRYLTQAFLYHVVERKPRWTEYRKNMQMYVGEQWTKEEQEELQAQKKPALVFNHIARQINLLTGYERSERKKIIARPVGDDDVSKAAIATGAMAHIDRISNAEYETTEASENSFIMAEGILGFLYDFDEGRYKIASESPFNHIPDRDCYDRNWKTARIHFRFKWMSRNRIMSMYPDRKGDLDQIKPAIDYQWDITSSDDEGFENLSVYQKKYDMRRLPADMSEKAKKEWGEFYDHEEKKWRVIECYERVVRKVTVIVEKDEEGNENVIDSVPYHIDEKGEIVENVEELKKVLKGMKNYKLDTRKMYRIRLTVFAGDIILDDGFTKYPRIPFVPLFSYFKHDGQKKWIHGFVHKLTDPQIAYNKVKSQLLYMLNKSAGNVIIMTAKLAQGLAPDRLRQALNNVNDVVVAETDSVAENVDWGQIKPHSVPREFFTTTEEQKQEMVEIGSIDQQAMMGMSTKGDPSGWAIELKQKQGVLQIMTPFDNIKESRLTFYRDLVWPMIRNSNIKERVRKELLGDVNIQAASLPINMRPSEMSQQELGDVGGMMDEDKLEKMMAADEVFNPLADLEVDITFDDTKFTTTERMRILTMLLKMRESGIPVPPALIMQFTDEPVRNKIMDYMQEMEEAEAGQQQNEQAQSGAPQGGQF